jgi:hypothetical protein
MIKWNATGRHVYISRFALDQFLSDRSLQKTTKAVAFNPEKGPKNSRCFVAEHMFPTRALQEFTYSHFAAQDPSFEEFRAVFTGLNCLCYVWYEEDLALQASGLKSSIATDQIEGECGDCYAPDLGEAELEQWLKRLLLRRYANCSPPIYPIETSFSDGQSLFRYLDNARSRSTPVAIVLKELAA